MMNPEGLAGLFGAVLLLWASWWLLDPMRSRERRVAATEYARALHASKSSSPPPPRAAAADAPAQWRNPLAGALRAAVDAVPPALLAASVEAGGSEVLLDAGETREVAELVVRRIDAAVPQARLALIGVESARKTVDRYKTVQYDLVVNLHAAGAGTTGMGARVAATVLLAKNAAYVQRLTVDGDPADPSAAAAAAASGPLPASGLAETAYAEFRPAI